MTNEIDPRPYYQRALHWANGVVLGVGPAVLDGPTPCSEYDVRTLLGHLVATVDRARGIGEGGDPRAMPSVVADVPDDGWGEALAVASDKMSAVWADGALLDRPVTVPWGTVPGRAAMWGYVNEALVHGWDLAVATGQDAEADPDLAEAALAGAQAKIPPDRRGGPIPFADVVESAPDAGPTERLANWSGHRRP
jgi:uncharacterized protein (TIGR03086 family)